jgi:ligand-binding sensor domain-containing protein
MFKQLLQSILSFLFLFSIYTSAICQTSYELVHIYTRHDGLSTNHITSITRGSTGLLLIGTHHGIHIYNGYNFQLTNSTSPPPLTLNANKVNSFEIGNNGYSWIGSINGINKINPFDGSNILYFNQGNLKYPPLKPDTISNTLLASSPNGKMWIVNNGIICQIINEEVKQYFPERFNTITKVLSDHESNLYALSNQSLIGLNASGHLLFELKEFNSPLFGLQEISKMSNLFKTKKNEIIIQDHLNDRYFKIDSLGKIEDLTAENHWLPIFFKELDLQIKTSYIKDLRKFDFEETSDGLIWIATNIGLVKMKITSTLKNHAPKKNLHFIFLYKKYDSFTGELKPIFLNPNNVEPIYLNPKERYLEIQFFSLLRRFRR